MKQIQKPPFKQKAIAIGFTIGVHAIAIVGLLYLGLSKPPEPPKKLKTYLVDPKTLPQTEQTETATAPEQDTAQTAEPTEQPKQTTPDTQQLAALAAATAAKHQAALQAQKQAEAEA